MSAAAANLGRSFRHMRRNVLLFLAILGPGMITANVDNDAGGITTYSLAGAHYGNSLLWVLLPVTVCLILVQEMCTRMGAVTGKGLSDLIRENFGVKATFYTMIALLLTNVGNAVAEFAGIAASMEIFGVSRYISVPISAVVVWLLIFKGSFKLVEKVFLAACLVYLAYPVAAFLARPDWGAVAREAVTPRLLPDAGYLVTLIGVVGTSIAPWMQFYQQATVVEKGITLKEYPFSRLDTVIGCTIMSAVAFFIMVACATTLNLKGLRIETAADAAVALQPLVGDYASMLFAIGLFNASLFAACILPLSTAYYVCEGMGWEWGIDAPFGKAPQFFVLFTSMVAIAAGTILIPGVPLIRIMFLSQVVNGIMLPLVLIGILLLINNRDLMGEHVNGRTMNVLTVAAAAVMIACTLLLLAHYLLPSAVSTLLGG